MQSLLLLIIFASFYHGRGKRSDIRKYWKQIFDALPSFVQIQSRAAFVKVLFVRRPQIRTCKRRAPCVSARLQRCSRRLQTSMISTKYLNTATDMEAIAPHQQNRFLRGIAEIMKTLTLAAWMSSVRRSPELWNTFSIPTHLFSYIGLKQTRNIQDVVNFMLSSMMFVSHLDGSLGPVVGKEEDQEAVVVSALSEGCARALETIRGLQGLATILNMTTPPARIETFDISHFQGTHTVGASAVLHCGSDCLSEYVCYPILFARPADDPAAISEALRARLLDTSRVLPDVILIDGGKGQLSAASAVVTELGMDGDIQLLSLAKREEHIMLPNVAEPLVLPHSSPTLKLLQRQRDEAHACALLSHRSLRHQSQFASVLDESGLSIEEQELLRKTFDSATSLRNASAVVLSAILSRPGAGVTAHAGIGRSLPSRAVNLTEEMGHFASAVDALARSRRQKVRGAQREDWEFAEARARSWWVSRRNQQFMGSSEQTAESVRIVLESLRRLARLGGSARASSAVVKSLGSWSSPLAGESLNQLTVNQLRVLLRNKGMKVAGKKDDLVNRLLKRGQKDVAGSRNEFDILPGSFCVVSEYEPAGDQSSAIKLVAQEVESGKARIALRGATGTGKTFVMAKTIEKLNRPALVIAPNKLLAAQLFTEFQEFFPSNSVQLFMSHFDYYLPESFTPATDTYREKESSINDQISAMRHNATRSLRERSDTLVVATVSCIYGLGMPEEYLKSATTLRVGQLWHRKDLERMLSRLNYVRAFEFPLEAGEFDWMNGGSLALMIKVPYETLLMRVELEALDDQDDELLVEGLCFVDDLSVDCNDACGDHCPLYHVLYPARHNIVAAERTRQIIHEIQEESKERVAELCARGDMQSAERLMYRVQQDVGAMAHGKFKGMENYARYFDGRAPGEAPSTLLDYMPENFLLIVDESHITVPQINGMYAGDHSRKKTLIEHGFRLPSAHDHRPLRGDELWERAPQAVFVSATPGKIELGMCGPDARMIDLVARPTGILDPQVHVIDTRSIGGYEDHLLAQVAERKRRGERALVTCVTKRSAEELSTFLTAHGIPAIWMHSSLKAAARLEAVDKLRNGEYDVMVGCNLLREGLDLPLVSLVCILDADKQGFLRSTTSLLQTIGRCARHINGTCLLYSDGKTSVAMREAMHETERRRKKQIRHNKKHGITPTPHKLRQKVKSRSIELINVLSGRLPQSNNSGLSEDWEKFEGVGEGDLELYDKIHAWRRVVARNTRKRPYLILHESTIRGIVEARPTTEAELIKVKGIGPKKMQAYGKSLLELVQEHLPNAAHSR